MAGDFADRVDHSVSEAQRITDAFESAETPADDTLVDKRARVTARIAKGKLGEVRVMVRGGTEDYCAVPAISSEAFEPNDIVTIVMALPGRLVAVRAPESALRVTDNG